MLGIWFQALSSHPGNGNNLRNGLLASSLSLRSVLHPFLHTRLHPGMYLKSNHSRLYYASESPRGIVKNSLLGPNSSVSDSVGLRRGPRICLSNKFPGDVEAAGQTSKPYVLQSLWSWWVKKTYDSNELTLQDLQPRQIPQLIAWSPLLWTRRQCRVAVKSAASGSRLQCSFNPINSLCLNTLFIKRERM